jgi:UDP-glucuronate decarboxylase
MDDWLQFLGFYLAEGWSTVRIRERKRKSSSIVTVEKDGYCGLSQNDGDTLQYMEEIVSRLPFKFSKKKLHNSENHYRLLCYDSNFAEYLTRFGKCSGKYIPDYVFDLSRHQQRLIFKTLMLGDGLSKGNAYFTNSEKLRDDFQRLCIHLGYTSDHYIIREKGTYYRGVVSNHNIHRISVQNKFGKKGSSCVTTINTPKKIEYDDYVYCVTVPNHTLITRRNGKVIVTGQSWGKWNSGPKKDEQPEGSFWVDADVFERRMLSSKDSWAFSGYEGYKPQSINTRII